MLIPDDPFAFVIPEKPDVRDLGGWETIFGCYQWFYVVGVRRLLSRAGVGDLSLAADQAAGAVAIAAWKKSYPALPWDEPLAGNQVRRAIARDPMCFDRALRSILAIHSAIQIYGDSEFREGNSATPLQRFIKLKPAYFHIEGSPRFLERPIVDHHPQIMRASYQEKPTFLKELHNERGATHQTLREIRDYLVRNKLHDGHHDISLKQDRRGRSAVLTVARSERVREFEDPETGEIT